MAVQIKAAYLQTENAAAQAFIDNCTLGADHEYIRTNGRPAIIRRSLGARALLRFLFARQFGQTSESWVISRDGRGKPIANLAPGENKIWISISHSAGLVAVALSMDGEIGIDIEDGSKQRSFAGIAEFAFGPRETAEALTSDKAFYRIWTLREALAKATGNGLSEVADQRDRVAGTLADDAWDMEIDSRWHYLFSGMLCDTFILALAVRAPAGQARDRWTEDSIDIVNPLSGTLGI